MAAFDNTIQKMVTLAGVRMETGRVLANTVSGFTFNVATKLKKVLYGFGVMEGDGLIAYPTTGVVSSGQVSWTRVGPIGVNASFDAVDAEDYINYILFGY